MPYKDKGDEPKTLEGWGLLFGWIKHLSFPQNPLGCTSKITGDDPYFQLSIEFLTHENILENYFVYIIIVYFDNNITNGYSICISK